MYVNVNDVFVYGSDLRVNHRNSIGDHIPSDRYISQSDRGITPSEFLWLPLCSGYSEYESHGTVATVCISCCCKDDVVLQNRDHDLCCFVDVLRFFLYVSVK